MIANGITCELSMEDAWAVAGILVATRRAPPISMWVDEAVRQTEEASLENFTRWG